MPPDTAATLARPASREDEAFWGDAALLPRALRSARLAFFSLAPDWHADSRGLVGPLDWIGTHFGVTDLPRRGLRAVEEAVCPEDRDLFRRIFLPSADMSRGGEFRIGRGDGRITVIHCDAAVDRGPDGAPRRIFGTLHDVTDRHRFEERLSAAMRERETLLGVIDACPVSITVSDARHPDLPLIYANRTFQALTGYAEAEIRGRNCRILQGPDSDPEVLRTLHDTVARGARADVRVLNYRKDGSAFVNHLVLAPIRDEGGALTAYIGLQSDVTDEAKREAAEQQRQRVEALGRMMGGVAHEINNLLQPVTLMTEELIDRHAGDVDRAYLDVILECATTARRVIGDLLAFSRPSGRKAEILPAQALLQDALVLIRKAVGPGVSIAVADAPCGLRVRADRTAFIQILLNLAGNAAAAMDGSGVIGVGLSTGRMDGPRAGRDCVRIDVTDTGCGMDRATIERAFEPFFTTKPVGQGTGLGLSVAYGLVKEMGGEIILESAPGRGTCASVLLPAADGDPDHGNHPRH